MESNLASINPPVGIYPTFFSNQPVILTFQNRTASTSGDVPIIDPGGQLQFICQGEAWALHPTKVLKDPQGQVLFVLQHKGAGPSLTYGASDASGNELFVFERPLKLFNFNPSYIARFRNQATGAFAAITVKRTGKSGAEVTLGDNGNGPVIARILQDFLGGSRLLGGGTFNVIIAPGVDVALIAAITILYEKYRDSAKRAWTAAAAAA